MGEKQLKAIAGKMSDWKPGSCRPLHVGSSDSFLLIGSNLKGSFHSRRRSVPSFFFCRSYRVGSADMKLCPSLVFSAYWSADYGELTLSRLCSCMSETSLSNADFRHPRSLHSSQDYCNSAYYLQLVSFLNCLMANANMFSLRPPTRTRVQDQWWVPACLDEHNQQPARKP